MVLYHFTSPDDRHLGSILRDGQIKTTESNVSPFKIDAVPRVVWMTTNPDPAAHAGWSGPTGMKTVVRFTIDVPKFTVMPWTEFARRHNVPDFWQRAMITAAGGGSCYRSWYVRTTAIPAKNWSAVEQHDAAGVWSPLLAPVIS